MTELVGNRRSVKVQDLIQLLKKHTDWPSWKKISVALIVIIEGVVAVKSQLGLVNENIVEMCRDINFFLEYPWDRHAFQQTLSEIVKDKSDGSRTTLVGRLKQSYVAMHGFPLSIQLLAYETISGLDQIHRESGDEVDFTQRSTHQFCRLRPISQDDVIMCELSDELVVESISHTSEEYELENTTWDDDVVDPKIERRERMIKSGHIFTKHYWPGGDFSCSRVHSSLEKGLIKDYEAIVQRRKQKGKLLAKRKRDVDEGEEPETSSKRSKHGKKPRLPVLRDQCVGKSRKVKGADNSVQQMIVVDLVTGGQDRGDILPSFPVKVRDKKFDDYDGVESVLRSVHNLEECSANEQCTSKDVAGDIDNMDCALADVHGTEATSSLVECTIEPLSTSKDDGGVAAGTVTNAHVGDVDCTSKDIADDTDNMECPSPDVHGKEAASSLVEYTREPICTPKDDGGVAPVGDVTEPVAEGCRDGDEELERCSRGRRSSTKWPALYSPRGVRTRNPTAKAKSLVKPSYLYDPLGKLKKSDLPRIMKRAELHIEPTFLLSSEFEVDKNFFSQLAKKHEFVSSIVSSR
ncbi:unnamed protein product [Arabis nemorensis]|uniref:DUF1985 domain-containing protein n=1 Tax=Arabis nemorensis TaxID=586526 RepID=A0A565BSG0_9BRAS|nr:unnamed protein product [Arabis nemorensis]